LEEAEIEKISPEDEVSIEVPCNDGAGDAAIVEKISKGPAIPALGSVLRSAILVLRAGHVFFSKAHSDKMENHDSPRVPLLSPPHRVCVFLDHAIVPSL
jgi:Ca2+-transporting ATPase